MHLGQITPYYKENQCCYNILQNISHIWSHLILTISKVGIIFSHLHIGRKKPIFMWWRLIWKPYFSLQVIIFLAYRNDWFCFQPAFMFAILNILFLWNHIWSKILTEIHKQRNESEFIYFSLIPSFVNQFPLWVTKHINMHVLSDIA